MKINCDILLPRWKFYFLHFINEETGEELYARSSAVSAINETSDGKILFRFCNGQAARSVTHYCSKGQDPILLDLESATAILQTNPTVTESSTFEKFLLSSDGEDFKASIRLPHIAFIASHLDDIDGWSLFITTIGDSEAVYRLSNKYFESCET